jgi:hypothetical protein
MGIDSPISFNTPIGLPGSWRNQFLVLLLIIGVDSLIQLRVKLRRNPSGMPKAI